VIEALSSTTLILGVAATAVGQIPDIDETFADHELGEPSIDSPDSP